MVPFQYFIRKDNESVTVTTIEDLKSQIADSLGYDKTQIILKDKYDCILRDDMDVFDLLFTYKKIIINDMNPELKVTIPFGLTKKDAVNYGPNIESA